MHIDINIPDSTPRPTRSARNFFRFLLVNGTLAQVSPEEYAQHLRAERIRSGALAAPVEPAPVSTPAFTPRAGVIRHD